MQHCIPLLQSGHQAVVPLHLLRLEAGQFSCNILVHLSVLRLILLYVFLSQLSISDIFNNSLIGFIQKHLISSPIQINPVCH